MADSSNSAHLQHGQDCNSMSQNQQETVNVNLNLKADVTLRSEDPRSQAILDKLQEIGQQLQSMIQKENQLMATVEQFQAKIDTINANTTASAAAAQIIAANDSALKAQLDDVLTKAGVPADVEEAILAKLDQSAQAGAALKTFLESTAAGPVTAPEPEPVPTPQP